MENKNEVKITTYDKIMRAWENSMELARDFEVHSKEMRDNDKAAKMFKQFAEDEGIHAAELRKVLLDYQS